jgi:nicotinamide-nucleotide amidase
MEPGPAERRETHRRSSPPTRRYGAPVALDALTGPAAAVAQRLTARGQSLAVAESSAGGLISAALVSVAGASAYYQGGFVVYTLDGATAMLGGATELDPGSRGASEPFARFLAASAAARLGADWGLGETGATGPTGNRYGDPAGHAWLAVAGRGRPQRTQHVLTGDDRRTVNMQAFAVAALELLAAELA